MSASDTSRLTALAVVGHLGARNHGEEAMSRVRFSLSLAALVAVVVYTAPSSAQTIIDEWSNIKAPPAPKLTAVTIDPQTTALLMLDFLKQNCAPNPRCVASLPKAQKLLVAARAKGLTIIYSNYPGGGDILPEVALNKTEPLITAFLDKFTRTSKDGIQDTGLDKILKDKGIKTVIVVGSAANGAVLNTGTSAFFHGYQTIIPVDGMSGGSPYIEQEVVYNFVSTPVMGGKIILTRIDMIKFAN
jgi:nicotinamidase-related amidase